MLLGPVWAIFCLQEINYFLYSISAAKPNNFHKVLYVKNTYFSMYAHTFMHIDIYKYKLVQ